MSCRPFRCGPIVGGRHRRGVDPVSSLHRQQSKLFSIKLFGGATIESADGPLTGRAAQRHRLALLAVLATRRSGLSRDRLTALLWPDSDPERGRPQLSDSVYRINSALGEVIQSVGEELRLKPDSARCDVVEFEAALDRGDLDQAVATYTGPFLDGFSLPDNVEFEQWLDAERQRLSARYLEALEKLADRAQQQGNPAEHVRWAQALATADRYSSRAALRYIQALDQIGERAAALKHARVHESILRELELEPTAEFVRAVAHIRSAPQAASPVQPTQQPPAAPIAVARSVFQSESPVAKSKWQARAALAAVAAVVLIAGGWLILRDRSADARDRTASVAVLPLVDHSANGDQQYFSDGLTEELISALSRVEELRVAARTSTFALRNSGLDVRAIGRRLNVGHVLEGSVRQGNGRLRVTVQLIDARNGYEVWTQTFDRTPADVLVVQEEIARAIVQKLKGGVLPSETAAFASTTIDPAAYSLFMRGRYHWHRRDRTNLKLAVDFLEQAVAQAPMFGRAWSGLADAYAVSGFYDYIAPRQAFPKAETAARRALHLDPQSAAAYSTLAYVDLYYRWNFPDAEQHFLQALQLDSSYSTAHQWYGNLLTAAGRFPEAEQAMRRATLHDPLSLIANAALGWSIYFSRRYDAAERQLQETLALDSTFTLAHTWRGWVLEELGRLDDMQRSLERGTASQSAVVMSALARGHAVRGEAAQATALLRKLESGAYGYAPAYELAKIYLALGQKERALTLLEQAVQERAHSIAFVNVDPQLDELRGEPRFAAIARQITR